MKARMNATLAKLAPMRNIMRKPCLYAGMRTDRILSASLAETVSRKVWGFPDNVFES